MNDLNSQDRETEPNEPRPKAPPPPPDPGPDDDDHPAPPQAEPCPSTPEAYKAMMQALKTAFGPIDDQGNDKPTRGSTHLDI